MLEAGWQLYEGEYFRHRVEISTKELEFLTNRMNTIGSTATILAGFAFTALVELDIDQATGQVLTQAGYDWSECVYYVSISITVCSHRLHPGGMAFDRSEPMTPAFFLGRRWLLQFILWSW